MWAHYILTKSNLRNSILFAFYSHIYDLTQKHYAKGFLIKNY